MSKQISVKDRLPKADTRVLISYIRRSNCFNGKERRIQSIALYENGTVPDDESKYLDFDAEFDEVVYDEKLDEYIIPAGWYEVLTSTNAEYFCGLSDNEIVTHWMPMPKPPKEAN